MIELFEIEISELDYVIDLLEKRIKEEKMKLYEPNWIGWIFGINENLLERIEGRVNLRNALLVRKVKLLNLLDEYKILHK